MNCNIISARTGFIIFALFALLTWFVVQREDISRGLSRIMKGNDLTTASPRFSKARAWERCKRLISGKKQLKSTTVHYNDSNVLDKYNSITSCSDVLRFHFVHPEVSEREQRFPIAFALTVYKDTRLLERILRAIYMPHNLYCIHIDKKSQESFRRAVQSIIRCLPNVFITKQEVDVFWGHISVVHAQLSCMRELLESPVKWKYFINLIGQDFPLYENSEIVTALQGLNWTNSVESFPIPEHNKGRTQTVHILSKDGKSFYNTGEQKSPPPHNIVIHKGSTHIVAIREFVDFVLNSRIGKDFIAFLTDAYVPDEILYASLQQHPLTPGGIHGKQPEWIPRALHWQDTHPECHGDWVRTLCWISIEDLRWGLGREMSTRLFVHKIPFDYSDDLLNCILVARLRRKYPTILWPDKKPNENIK